VVKFVFSHSKLRKQPFFAEIFKIQQEKAALPTPMARNVSGRYYSKDVLLFSKKQFSL